MVGFIGERAKEAWLKIRQFLEHRYYLVPETRSYGANYGWTIRYRRGGKILSSLFPEKGGFTDLIVLGKKEIERALSKGDELSFKIRELLWNKEQLHDGC